MSTTATATTDRGTISAARQIANLHSAENIVSAQLSVDRYSLSYEQRAKYNRALALVITQYPDRFSPGVVQQAQYTLSKNYTPLEDTGFDIKAFENQVVDNAIGLGNDIGGVGKGIANSLSALKWLLPALVIGGGALFVYIKVKKSA